MLVWLLLAVLVGVEASAWLHLIQDGDPLPRTPRLLRILMRSGRRRLRRPRQRRASHHVHVDGRHAGARRDGDRCERPLLQQDER